MTFFSKLFGKRPVAVQTEAPAVMETAPKIAKDLFVEDRHPEEFGMQEAAEKSRSEKTILEGLLDRDYQEMGHRDGYHMHDLSWREMRLELIAADFRQAFDMALQDIDIQLDQLGMHLTAILEEEAPDLHKKIQIRHDQLVRQRRELMLQKDLAVTGEGFVEKSAKYYKAGFREGYDLYIQEELIFKHIKTL